MNKYLILSFALSAGLFSNPQDFHILHGAAKITDHQQTMVVDSRGPTIIDWGRFSIGPKESVIFNQTSPFSAILNRVIGSEISSIQGSLTSNGHVFLINPNGIVIGKNGIIQTNSFVASTLDFSNEQFLQRDGFNFNGKDSGSIVNLGKIEALDGDVFLLSASIKNEGILAAPMGTVGLALGTTIRLTPVAGQYLSIEYTMNESPDHKYIENNGVIKGCDVALIASQNPYALAIKQSGTIEATAVRSEGGKIFLVAEKGGIDVDGIFESKAGDIHFLADYVQIQPDTNIAAPEGKIVIANQGKPATTIVTFPGARLRGAEISLNAVQSQDFAGEIYGTRSVHLSTSEGYLGVSGKVDVPGGVCHILAKDIRLGSETTVNVSGDRGGTILIGGDYKGGNVDIPNAETLIVDTGAYFNANGLTHDAGKIIFWSNQKTYFYGEATAQALGDQGCGGFVEVSAKSNDYRFLGHVNTFSKSGKTGTLLLDPVDITINNFGGISNPLFPTTPPGTYAPSGISAATLDVGTLSSSLGLNNVIIDSTQAGTGNGDVIFLRGPSWSANTTLTVSAHRYIWVQSAATISSTHPSSTSGVIFTAQGNGTVISGLNADGIHIDGTISTNGGQISLNGKGVATPLMIFASGVGLSPGSKIVTATGPISITGTGNASPLEGNGVRITGGTIEVTGNAPDLILSGTGATGTTPNGSNGTIIRDGGIVRVSGTTNMVISGTTNNASAGANTGFEIFNNSSCTALGTGNITITAIVGAATGTLVTGISQGVSINNNATLSSTSGTIQMNITNASVVPGCVGLELIGGNGVISSTSGLIDIDATLSGAAQNGTACLISGGRIISATGNIDVQALNTTTAGSNQWGLQIFNPGNRIETTGGGTITVNGKGGGNGSGNHGVLLQSGSILSSQGNITVVGESGPGTNNNQGIRIEGGQVTASTSAALQMTGTGNGTGTNCSGIYVASGGSNLSSVNGQMLLTGFGSTNGSSGANGVHIEFSSNVLTLGTGGLTINGTAQSNTGTTHNGVRVSDSAIVSASGTGPVTITASNTGGTSSCYGMLLLGGGVVTSTSGNITINATNSALTGPDQGGVLLTGLNSKIESGTGQITLNGTGGGTTGQNRGIAVTLNGFINTTSTGGVQVTGTGGGGSTSYGTHVSAGEIRSVSGSVVVIGTGGTNPSGNQNRGVMVDASGSIRSQNGTVQVNGTGGAGTANCDGVFFNTSGLMATPNQSYQINGNSSSGTSSHGVNITPLTAVSAGGTGSLNIVGHSTSNGGQCIGININGTTISATGTGNISITNGLNSGGTGSGGEVGVQCQSAIISATGGGITILGRGGTTATLPGSSGGNHGVFVTGGSIVAPGVIDITGIGGNSNASNHGVMLVNPTINGNGSNTVIITGTGANPISPPVPSIQNIGISINGGTIQSVGGGFSLNGTGGNSTSGENHGIQINGNGLIQSMAVGAATPLSIVGTANLGSASRGIFINQGGIKTLSTSLLTVQGTTNSTSTGAQGISIQNNQTVLLASIDVGTGGLNLTGTGGNGANQSLGYELSNTRIRGTGVMNLRGVSRDTSGSPRAVRILTSQVLQNSVSGDNLTLTAEDGEWSDIGAGGSIFQLTGTGQLNIQTTLGGLSRGGDITFIGSAVSTVTTTSGPTNIIAAGTGKQITMGLSGSVGTTGGNATITAPSNVILGRVNVVNGSINVTATTGAISNGTGTIATPALTGLTATLIAATGAGSGTSSSVTAIPTQLTNLGGTITGIGNIVIFEQTGLNLNAISTANGGLDIDAGSIITQTNPLTIAGVNGYAFFTTSRATSFGTVSIRNSQSSSLGVSLVAGDYTFQTVPASSVVLSGNQTIGRDFSITSSSYNPAGFTVLTGGTYKNNGVDVLPSPTNTINAFGVAPNFDISTATLAGTGDITINLRAIIQTPTNLQLAPAVTLTNGGNAINGPIRVTTVNPNFSGTPTDYNLVQTAPLVLNAGQNLIINAAQGVNNPNVTNPANPSPTPFTTPGSTLNAGNGSNITLTNPANSFGGWISIRDPQVAQVTSNGNIVLENVNTYGNLTITSVGGSITTGFGSSTTRSAGNTIAFSSGGNITLNGTVKNLTTNGTLKDTITYTSTGGSINGASQTSANQIALSAASGTIGLIAPRMNVDAPNIVFSSQGNAFLGVPRATVIAGDTTGVGGIDVLLTVPGDLTIDAQNFGSLNKNGLQSAGSITAATNNGNMIINQPVAATGNGPINLNALVGNMNVNEVVSSNGGIISIVAATNLTHSILGDVTTNGAGTITATATSGALTMVDGTVYSTAGGNITLTSNGNTALGTVNAGAGDIRSTATSGNITNILAVGANVIGNRANLRAANGIGVSIKPILTTVGELQANVTGTGGLHLSNSNTLSLTNWDGSSPGISTVDGVISVTNTAGNQTVATNVSVGGGANTLQLQATAGALTMNNGTIASTAGGNATILANTNIALSQINVGAGLITATATTGAISNNTASLAPPNLTGTTATLTSATGIGSGAPTSTSAISTNLINLGASATSGPIVIRENNALNLNSISAGNGDVGIDAGGLVQQNVGTTLSINGALLIQTNRDASIGTVVFLNSTPTNLGASIIAGDWTVTTTPNQSITLTGSSFVGRNYTFTGTPFNDGVFTITQGGTANINGMDPDLVGPGINATGANTDFNLSLTTLGPSPAITVNLRGVTNLFGTVVTPNAIIVGNNGNSVSGNAVFVTTNPTFNGVVLKDYNLVQTAPITLNIGQTMTINAARGAANTGVSGALDSPFSGSTLNGNAGSNITLNLANNFNGNLVIKDPNIAIITAASNLSVGHINNYGDLTLVSQGGTIATGVIPMQNVRSAGSAINFTAPSTIAIGSAVQAIDVSGNLNGNIFYTSTGGNISGLGTSSAGGIAYEAPVGLLGTFGSNLNTVANRIVFNAKETYISNVGTNLSIAGQTLNGPIALTQGGAPTNNLTVAGTTVGAINKNNLVAVGGDIAILNNVSQIIVNQNITATGQAISLAALNSLIQQGGGIISTGATGTISFTALSGVTGIGPNNSILIESLSVNGINGVSGELKITNQLVGPNTLEATAMLINGTGGFSSGRNIYYNQKGGSSVKFNGLVGDGTATLLAIEEQANMSFNGQVLMGGQSIAVANKNVDIGNVIVSILGNTTIVCDQKNPAVAGLGVFSNQGIFTIGTNNLAIYASSGPEAPANAKEPPPNRAILGGNLGSLAVWDENKSPPLISKYSTSYSAGGPAHGAGFGTNYIPGNGVFGSWVIWYKFIPELIPNVNLMNFKGVLRLIGINAWVDKRYFMNDWFKGPFCTGKPDLFSTACDEDEIRLCK